MTKNSSILFASPVVLGDHFAIRLGSADTYFVKQGSTMQTIQTRKNREELITHCAEILRKKGYQVDVKVPCGVDNSLRADLVTRTTVYEFRDTLAKTPLYAGTGQGLVYAWWLRRRRVVVVGYLPLVASDLGDALIAIPNIEKTGYVKISIVDQDPFWGMTSVSYRPLGYVALLVGAIALAVFAIPLLREQVECRVYPAVATCPSDRVYRP